MTGVVQSQETQDNSATVVSSPNKTYSDDLSEAERAYFNSGGSDISGLLKEDNYKTEVDPIRDQLTSETKEPEQRPATEVQPASTTSTTQASEESLKEDDEFNFDDLRIGPDGRLRDTSGKYVPLEALRKERTRFKQQRDTNVNLEQENRALKDNYTKLEQRINTLQELWKQPAQAQEQKEETPPAPKYVVDELIGQNQAEEPKLEEDIYAFVSHQSNIIKQQQEALRKLEDKFNSSTKEIRDNEIAPVRQQLTDEGVIRYYRDDAARFLRENPDFAEAYKYIIDQRHATLALTGFADANERMKQIQTEERQLVNLALTQNKRPAEYLFNYAVASGFKPTPKADPNPAPATSQPAVATQPASQSAAAATTINPTAQEINNAERLLAAQRAQNAAPTLSGTGGTSTEMLSQEVLANMSDAEFAAMAAKLGRGGMRQYLGG